MLRIKLLCVVRFEIVGMIGDRVVMELVFR